MGSVPGGRHGWISPEASSGRAGIYFVPDRIQCRKRLFRLMGSETADLMSARYMDALAEKVLQEYEEKQNERERELAQNEIRRERDLIIRGLIPDPDEHKKRSPKKGPWGTMRRHRGRTQKEPSSGRPPHPKENMPEGLSNYQRKIFCSSNFRDFTDDVGSSLSRGLTSSEMPESKRTSRGGTKSSPSRK